MRFLLLTALTLLFSPAYSVTFQEMREMSVEEFFSAVEDEEENLFEGFTLEEINEVLLGLMRTTLADSFSYDLEGKAQVQSGILDAFAAEDEAISFDADFQEEETTPLYQIGVYTLKNEKNPHSARLFLESDSTNPDAKMWLAYCLFSEFDNWAEAEELLEQLIAEYPNNPDYLFMMAKLAHEGPSRDLDKAIAYINQALSFAPDYPILWEKLAWFELIQGNQAEAEKAAQKMLQTPSLSTDSLSPFERFYETAITGRAWTQEEKQNHLFFTYVADLKRFSSPTAHTLPVHTIGSLFDSLKPSP